LAGKEYGASDHANKKSTGYDEHDQANRIGRRLEASYLSVQEFLVSTIHMHLDPASLPVRTISPSICSAISESVGLQTEQYNIQKWAVASVRNWN
jgi:hypothetical protein